MPAMMEDPDTPTIYRVSGPPPYPSPTDPISSLPPTFHPRHVTLRDRQTVATVVPFPSASLVPHSLLTYLCDQFNKEIEGGDTYPMIVSMSVDRFSSYWFQNFGAIMLLGHIPSASDVRDEAGDVDWSKQCLGSFYIKPNYPGRSSHVCNAGFLVTDLSRNRGAGRLMGETYIEWAPRLGYTYSVFNLVYETNVASCKIWDALGFKRIGRVKACGSLKSHPDRLVDAIIYGRDLSVEEAGAKGGEGNGLGAGDIVSEDRFDKIKFYLRYGKYPGGADRAEKSRLRSAATHYKLVGDKLMLKDKEVISDPVEQYDIARRVHRHNDQHGGINKTTATIAEKYHWSRIKETVSDVIRTCAECKEAGGKTGAAVGTMNGAVNSLGAGAGGSSMISPSTLSSTSSFSRTIGAKAIREQQQTTAAAANILQIYHHPPSAHPQPQPSQQQSPPTLISQSQRRLVSPEAPISVPIPGSPTLHHPVHHHHAAQPTTTPYPSPVPMSISSIAPSRTMHASPSPHHHQVQVHHHPHTLHHSVHTLTPAASTASPTGTTPRKQSNHQPSVGPSSPSHVPPVPATHPHHNLSSLLNPIHPQSPQTHHRTPAGVGVDVLNMGPSTGGETSAISLYQPIDPQIISHHPHEDQHHPFDFGEHHHHHDDGGTGAGHPGNDDVDGAVVGGAEVGGVEVEVEVGDSYPHDSTDAETFQALLDAADASASVSAVVGYPRVGIGVVGGGSGGHHHVSSHPPHHHHHHHHQIHDDDDDHGHHGLEHSRGGAGGGRHDDHRDHDQRARDEAVERDLDMLIEHHGGEDEDEVMEGTGAGTMVDRESGGGRRKEKEDGEKGGDTSMFGVEFGDVR